MKKMVLSLVILILSFSLKNNLTAQENNLKQEETIFVYGGDINLKFIKYVAELTKKENPKLCFVPTAIGDHQDNITFYEKICERIGIEPNVLKVWVSSSPENKSFEDIIMNSDAIVVGGGNTLNMMSIWKGQGIDTIMQKAVKKGIILSGGSAGSICWFMNGISDSRPVKLSLVEGLGLLPFSSCPHYSQKDRKELYHSLLFNHKISSGYGCDELAGILFKDGKAVEFWNQSYNHNSYFVELNGDTVKSTKLESKLMLNKEAISEADITESIIKLKLSDLEKENNINSITAYINFRLHKDDISSEKLEKIKNTYIESCISYNDQLIGIVTSGDYIGLNYLYNNNGTWEFMGEDYGGECAADGKIVFREKAKIIIERAKEKYYNH